MQNHPHDIGAEFRALHKPSDPLLMVNAWDAGSARMIEGLGFKAIATTSAGHAFSLGRLDCGTISRDEALAHAQDLVSAVSIPVSGDFENGFGADPDTVAQTIRLAAEVGLAGCSIEDTDLPGTAPYPFDLAVERIRSAAAAARALGSDFMLVARADGVMWDSYDVAQAIQRIQAFEAAGADAVYVPAPPDMERLAQIIASVSVPVSVLASGSFSTQTLQAFADIGAARVSTGGALARVAYGAAIQTTKDMLSGSFTGLAKAQPETDINTLLDERTP